MAEIVMIKDRKPRWSRRDGVPGGGAEILLFTGVRYERFGSVPLVETRLASPSKRSAKRPAARAEPYTG